MDHDLIAAKLASVYGRDTAETMLPKIRELLEAHHGEAREDTGHESILITYGDTLLDGAQPSLRVLREFLENHVKSSIGAVHVLPFFPYSSDDGFSIIDYRSVDGHLGTWDDIRLLKEKYDIMLDAVINHVSSESEWFRHYLNCEEPYTRYFITCSPDADYSGIVRPRVLPLLTRVQTAQGEKYVWTTFSVDQIDLNFDTPEVFLEILDLLLYYGKQGARYIRLDAVGFLFKRLGTPCIHLPQTHTVIQLFRLLLPESYPGIRLITETNVPHEENISYFGNGHNEAHMVYQFMLPPLVLYSFLNHNTRELTHWAQSLVLPEKGAAFFNFLASHDGIGLRPLEGRLPEAEVRRMADVITAKGGLVSYKSNPDGTQTPYEFNVNYLSAVTEPDDPPAVKAKKFLASQAVILSMAGVPGIYIHSLLGSENWGEGARQSGLNRRINREKLQTAELEKELRDPNSLRSLVFYPYLRMLDIRKTRNEFQIWAEQRILSLDDRLFCLRRDGGGDTSVLVVINFSGDRVPLAGCAGTELLTGRQVPGSLTAEPYEVLWIEQQGKR